MTWQATAVFLLAVFRRSFLTASNPSWVITVFHVDVPILLANESRTLQVFAMAFFWHCELKITIIGLYSRNSSQE